MFNVLVLDARFKLRGYEGCSNPEEKELLKSVALGHLRSMLKDREEDPSNQHNESQISSKHVRKKHRLHRFAFLRHSDASSADASVSKWERELQAYIEAPLIPCESDVLEWWHLNETKYPALSKLARVLLAIQPTGKDVESSFSEGRMNMPYMRNRLGAENFKAQMLVNSGVSLGII